MGGATAIKGPLGGLLGGVGLLVSRLPVHKAEDEGTFSVDEPANELRDGCVAKSRGVEGQK